MPTIQIEAQLSNESLWQATLQLSPDELEQFASRLQTLRAGVPLAVPLAASPTAPVLSPDESALLLSINAGLSPDERARFDELVGKRRARGLSPDEQEELIALTDHSENLNAIRMKALAQLARGRGQSLDETMHSLGIEAPEPLF